jgi:hypothetical protein
LSKVFAGDSYFWPWFWPPNSKDYLSKSIDGEVLSNLFLFLQAEKFGFML